MTTYYLTIILVSHLIMFILMSYNLGIIIAVIIGNGIGFFLFGFNFNNGVSAIKLEN